MRRSNKLMALTVLAAFASVTAAQASRATVDVKRHGRVAVTAPGTRVAVASTSARTKVRVQAPYSDVRVNTAASHVRIRAPYFSGDISW